MDGTEAYVGSAVQLEQDGKVEVAAPPGTSPGSAVVVTVTAEKTDGSTVYPLLEERVVLSECTERQAWQIAALRQSNFRLRNPSQQRK